MDYNQILGHEKQIQSLKNSVKNKTISHSYIFEGEKGLGKRNIALAFSKTLLCREGQAEPCNKCISCTKFDTGNHPDFEMLSPVKGLISKKEVERLIRGLATKPFESSRKVFIIDESDTMRSDSQNALLKTLEEPPGFINIILIITNSNKLLPTIQSRCQNIKFYSIDKSKIIDLLVRDYNISQEKAEFIGSFTKGSLERAIELGSSEGFFKLREEIICIIDSLLKGDKTKAISSMDFFNENKEEIEEILDIAIYWFRDLLIYKEIGETRLLTNKDKIELLSSQSFVTLDKINDIIYKIEDTKTNIQRNVNFQLSIETMLLSI